MVFFFRFNSGSIHEPEHDTADIPAGVDISIVKFLEKNPEPVFIGFGSLLPMWKNNKRRIRLLEVHLPSLDIDHRPWIKYLVLACL